MALHFEFTNIENREEVCYLTAEKDDPNRGIKKGEKYIRPMLDAVIWASIFLGLGELTKKNIDRWVERFEIHRRLFGSVFVDDYQVTRADLEQFIGLTTNVVTESDAKWKNRNWSRIREEARMTIRRRKVQLEKEEKDAAA